ncbi:MFS transporter [Methylobrevis pamukkalensis]|uniref:Putative MFS-type transporter YcaD n=1 Tax=Methylobrevis pamukkalensis TaxID=1439726 RepID=A0A1E3GWQ0_9HYPH|nr:MFS transporter [Methylobrevis pamukkalensis]ODN68472.1 putative MFS-type transporter YcaD [Methylobrevis pamukkalensis]
MASDVVQPAGMTPGRRLLGISAAVAAISSVGIALGLGLPLLSLVMESRGVAGWAIGANTAMAGIASIAVTPLVTPVARRVGTAQLLVASIVTTAICFPLFYVFDSLGAWFVLRVLFHAALASAFILSEFWINALAPSRKRGLVMGIYATVLSIGFGVGPMILSVSGSEGPLPFVIGLIILLAAVVPVLFAFKANPPLDASHGRGFLRFVTLVPMATFAALVFGATESGLLSLLPIYGLRLGLDERTATLLVSAVALGNIGLQIPLGLLADRTDRRVLLCALALICTLLMLITPFAAHDTILLFAVMMVFGGLFAGLYTVGLTHLGARLSGGDLASANAAFIFMYSVGMLGGPALGGLSIDVEFTRHGFPLLLATFLGSYMLLGSWRILRDRRRGR